MKKYCLITLFSFLSCFAFAQVGIGTINPSPASMLEVSGTSDGGATYKGLMPPRVPTLADRLTIAPTASDTGLLIFLESTDCLQVWNGTDWENVYCLGNPVFTNVVQNFDLNTTWGYVSDVPFFDNGTDGFYGVTDSSNGDFNNITTLTNNFLGIYDLQDDNDGGNGGNNGTTDFATITFDTIDISAASSGVIVSFDYEFFEFDNNDDAFYRLIVDGNPQTEFQLIEGSGDLSLSGTISENIVGGTNSISLEIRIKQNGEGDYAGFDNFSIVAQ